MQDPNRPLYVVVPTFDRNNVSAFMNLVPSGRNDFATPGLARIAILLWGGPNPGDRWVIVAVRPAQEELSP